MSYSTRNQTRFQEHIPDWSSSRLFQIFTIFPTACIWKCKSIKKWANVQWNFIAESVEKQDINRCGWFFFQIYCKIRHFEQFFPIRITCGFVPFTRYSIINLCKFYNKSCVCVSIGCQVVGDLSSAYKRKVDELKCHVSHRNGKVVRYFLQFHHQSRQFL